MIRKVLVMVMVLGATLGGATLVNGKGAQGSGAGRPYEAEAGRSYEMFLPMVVNDYAVVADPAEGDYSQETWLTFRVHVDGCSTAWPIFMTRGEYSPASFMIYHPECNENGYAGVIVSFARPVEIYDVAVIVYTLDGERLTFPVEGEWSFGMIPPER